jgi:predicted flap endonuclease-1-like 5' DNA nuclease
LEKAETAAEALPAFDIPDVVEIAAAQAGFLKKEIEYVEGIGPAYGAKLKAVGINTPLDLLQKGATRKGRELIAEAAGITITLILKWVNHADLFRLKGVGSEYADLLEAAGVDTVVELAQRNPVNLHNKMVATNEEKNLVRQLPSAAQVEGWVSEAKSLDRVVTY